MTGLLVIADDLTGATDTAGALASGGNRCVVALDRTHLGNPRAAGQVLVIDADSRAMTPTVAFAATADIVRRHETKALFLKIDSTLRGHVRSTVDAALSSMTNAPSRVVICPAFPSQGRTVIDGVVHVHGAPREGPGLFEMFTGWSSTGVLDIPDARNEHDLANIVASAITSSDGSVLWVGSAGIARHLAPALEYLDTSDAAFEDAPMTARHAAERVLVVAGSAHPCTAEQLTVLDAGTETLVINPHDRSFRQRVERAAASADALVLTGGATARAVLEIVGVKTLVVGGEVEPGVPWAVASGVWGDIAIVTKAGGFGDALTLQRAVHFLTRS